MGAAFRVIPNEIWTLEDIQAPAVFKDIIEVPRGLILVTGPTGSGKSTTLAAMIDHLNKTVPGHILTIEDPIEFVHTSQRCLINQREVKRDTHGFNQALRSALREDPDIILVGELRDIETVRLALTAAETGHLVFGTLHTSSAPKTIDRIIDVFPGEEKPIVRSMLSESLRAVVSQTLLKRVSGGRVGAHEIMVATPGHPQPDSRRQGGPDVLGHPDRPERRHDHAGPVFDRPGPARRRVQARGHAQGQNKAALA
jgi:twitching motility protein PilT